MNKLKLNILALGMASISLASCSESFLDVSSKTQSSTDNFYKTEGDVYRALLGCYDGWQCTVSNGGIGFYIASEMMADECFGGTGKADGRNYQVVDRFDIAQSSSDLNIYEIDWKSYYAAIYRCNELIAHEGQVAWTEGSTTRGLYTGECRAIRAILYFDMMRLWGNIPLFTEPVNENRPQADPKEVYNVIFEDLQYAIDNIPADAYPKAEAATNDGHITKYAAEAMMARAYLYYTGYYGEEPEGVSKANVLAGLEDVISSGEFDLIPEFKNLWPAASTAWEKKGTGYVKTDTYAGDGNKETVLTMKFNYTSDYNGNSDGNRWLVMTGIRALITPPYGQGWGACTVHPKMVNAYGSGDARRAASFVDLEEEGITAMSDFTKSHLNDQREYTGYTVKKYTPMGEWRQDEKSKEWGSVNAVQGLNPDGDFQICQYQDYVLMRYADVLLMAAELGSANAQDYFNQVRQRAYTDAEGNVSSNYTQVAVTKEAIMKERMLEFAFEGVRYWDLLRQGVDYAASQIAESGLDVKSGGIADQVVIKSEKIMATKGLSQIPYNQITLSNNVLKQNPGW